MTEDDIIQLLRTLTDKFTDFLKIIIGGFITIIAALTAFVIKQAVKLAKLEGKNDSK